MLYCEQHVCGGIYIIRYLITRWLDGQHESGLPLLVRVVWANASHWRPRKRAAAVITFYRGCGDAVCCCLLYDDGLHCVELLSFKLCRDGPRMRARVFLLGRHGNQHV